MPTEGLSRLQDSVYVKSLATREQQVTMLAVWHKPPGEKPGGRMVRRELIGKGLKRGLFTGCRFATD
jgi:hypothetical protein